MAEIYCYGPLGNACMERGGRAQRLRTSRVVVPGTTCSSVLESDFAVWRAAACPSEAPSEEGWPHLPSELSCVSHCDA